MKDKKIQWTIKTETEPVEKKNFNGYIGKNHIFKFFHVGILTSENPHENKFCLTCFLPGSQIAIYTDTEEQAKEQAKTMWENWCNNLIINYTPEDRNHYYDLWRKSLSDDSGDFITYLKGSKHCIKHVPTNIVMFDKVNPIVIKMVIVNLNLLEIKWKSKTDKVPDNFLFSCINILRFTYEFFGLNYKEKKKIIKRR